MSIKDKIIENAFTFDDVLLVPAYSEILPHEVCLKTKLSDKIDLNIPIISASMDTVTESQLAIALAREGGIGFIHKNMSIKQQAEEVLRVKRSENAMIYKPITLFKNQKIFHAKKLMKKYKISGFPVIDKNSKLIGIITNRDIKYQDNFDISVGEAMTKENLITSDENITLEQAKMILLKNRVEKLPIVNKKNILLGLVTIKDIDNLVQYPNAAKDEMGRLRVGAGIGTDSLDRVEALIDNEVDVILLDSAHGHSKRVLDKIKEIRYSFPTLDIIGGNIVTAAGAKDLIEAGANILKVGIGPGSICTTRIVAGVGIPQLSAIYNIFKFASKKKISVIADGGIKFSGDIVKALCSGASSVMLGSLLAGTDEAPGDEIVFQGRRFKVYQGMGSLSAMKRGGNSRYFQLRNDKLVPEGIEGRVPYKGKLSDVIYQLCGGVRSGMGYCGVENIEELQKKGKMVKITSSGFKESHVHDVIITQEAPNYSY